jgi:hypothetical protein
VSDHHLNGLVAGERSVLDAIDAGPDARANAGVPTGVGRDPDAGPMRLVDDGCQLLVGRLLRATAVLCDMTPPDAEILMTLARYLIWQRTALRTSGTPLAMPSSTLSGRTPGANR